MVEPLLNVNRRIGVLGVCVGLGLLLFGAGTVVVSSIPLRFVGFVSLIAGALVAYLWARFLSRPRLAIGDHHLYLYLGAAKPPFCVPLDVVEVFFIGQGAVTGEEPDHPDDYQGAVAANVIVRLAESAKEWHSREVSQWFALWGDGYITVRGLWCENIDQEVLKRMNSILMSRKRRIRETGQPG